MKPIKPLQILIVDDEVVVRETLTSMFEHFGHTAEWVGNGIAGKEALMKTPYDAAFVDMRMPGLDGIHLLEWAVEAQEVDLPIIIMTGHGAKDAHDEAIASGAFAFLNKPFRLKEIKQIIERIQQRRQ
jgi:DNA-binding NtrC family response regulator